MKQQSKENKKISLKKILEHSIALSRIASSLRKKKLLFRARLPLTQTSLLRKQKPLKSG
jgi:hypothetical protein